MPLKSLCINNLYIQGQLLNLADIEKDIQAFMVLLATGKNEEDPFKNTGTRFSHCLYGFFSRYSMAANSTVRSLDMIEIQIHTSFYGSPGYLQE